MERGMIGQVEEADAGEAAQEEVEDYVLNGYTIIYDKGDAILSVATQNEDAKVDGVAQAGFMVAKKLDDARIAAGKPPYPDEVKAVGGYHLVDKIIQFAEHAGIKPFNEAEKQAALQKTYKQYIGDGIKSRTIDPLQLAQSAEAAQPGSVTAAMAEIPDNIPQTNMAGAEQQPPQQAPPPTEAPPEEQKPQGLLNGPSPLEKFL